MQGLPYFLSNDLITDHSPLDNGALHISIIKKTFHDLYYTTEIADAQDLVSFIDSVRITEGCDTNTSFYGSHV
jgi:hypothetical protein